VGTIRHRHPLPRDLPVTSTRKIPPARDWTEDVQLLATQSAGLTVTVEHDAGESRAGGPAEVKRTADVALGTSARRAGFTWYPKTGL
jgi:hypothetical protein